ncbi:MAG: nitroreductase family protein, partial [Muribaculum sp.]|nr:nitroreductase family protein [Muribaculum sp.]
RAWHFVVVEDASKLEALSKCKPTGALPVAHCALAIVVAADVEGSEAWIEDCSIAATYIQLQAQDLGLSSCWIQVRGRYYSDEMESETYVQNLLEMPDNIMPVCIVTLGYSDETRNPQNIDKLQWDKVHISEWKER